MPSPNHPQSRRSCQQSAQERALALSRIVPLWPHEIADLSISGRHRLCRLLATALRRERQCGVAGHWTYDVSRHAALAAALRTETAALRQLTQNTKMPATAAGMVTFQAQ